MPQLLLKQNQSKIPYPLAEGTTLIGRQPECGVQLLAEGISRKHAQVVNDQGEVYLEDLGSENGTFVNGKRVEGSVKLNEGDRIKLCSLLLVFDSSEVAVDESARPADNPSEAEDRYSTTSKGLGIGLDSAAQDTLASVLASQRNQQSGNSGSGSSK